MLGWCVIYIAIPAQLRRTASTGTPTLSNVQPAYCGSLIHSLIGRTAGKTLPSYAAISQYAAIASRAFSTACSALSPAEKHPGRSGTATP
jgi:hypothetical protein